MHLNRVLLISSLSVTIGSLTAMASSSEKPLDASPRQTDEDAPVEAKWPHQTFRSRPDLQPPVLEITKSPNAPLSDGYLFFTVAGNAAHNYSTFIMTDSGELVYQSAIGIYTNAHVQTYNSQPVLTYFHGITYGEPWGLGYGIVRVLDESYTELHNVTVKEGIKVLEFQETDDSWISYIDMHESRIAPYSEDKTMLITAYNVTPADLTSINGPKDGWVTDAVFYEKDIATDETIFEWSALDHFDEIPFTGAVDYYPLTDDLGRNGSRPWGPFHINSVDKFKDGSYLVSSRFYCSLFKIGNDGKVIWRLDGQKGHDFTLVNDLLFAYQHDAQIREEITDKDGKKSFIISIFDNAWSSIKVPTSGQTNSRGIIMRVDEASKTATMLQTFEDPNDPLEAVSQANLQITKDLGNVVLGCGYVPKIKEFNKAGELVMSVTFGDTGNVQSYRGYKQPWIGKPITKPDVVAEREGEVVKVYMSWNGATEVRRWQVWVGESGDDMNMVTEVEKTGFETVAEVEGCGANVKVVKVKAVGEGVEGGESEVVRIA